MPAELRSALRSGRLLPVAVGLMLVVIVAAAIGGTAHFAGPRWYPHINGPVLHQRTGTTTAPTGPSSTAVPRHNHASGVPLWFVIALVVLIAAAIALLIWRVWSARRLPGAPERSAAPVQRVVQVLEPEPEPEPEKLLTGIELALKVLDDEAREPADAIVRAWLGLQETAEESGIVRGASETPTEFTTRILRGAFADDRAVRTLLRLYLRTRFGDHPVTSEEVAEVRDALAQLVSSWQAGGAARR